MGTRQQRRTYDQADENRQSHKNCRKRIRPPHFNSHVSYPFLKTNVPDQLFYGQRLFTVYPAAAPLLTAVPLIFIGTVTVTVTVVELPLLSVTLNVIV